MGIIEIQPIGWVMNAVESGGDCNWGGVVSEIRLQPEFADGLAGLEAFSHAVVVYHLHETTFRPSEHLARRPRNRMDMPEVGIFAQRARHRPNRIGVTTVAIQRVEGASLFVRGLDAINGTAVLDIKPHVRAFDAPDDSSEPEWVHRLMEGYF